LNPSNLTCEYLRNPLGIDVAKPRLSWALRSLDRDAIQTAYRVLVASCESVLGNDQGDLWDSGIVRSDRSTFVEYEGKPLASETVCHWKVRVWDRDGIASDWSETAFWTMGLLAPSDWNGEWISDRAHLDADETFADDIPPADAEAYHAIQKRPSPLLRKEFIARPQVARATAYICGLGFHELRINGKKVGDAVMQPAFTCYDKRALYITHDVTRLLRTGANAIGVMLGNGWFNSHSRDDWEFDRAPWRNTPRMLFQMRVEYADGSSEVIVSDCSWKTAAGPIVFDGIRDGECYDARLERPGWDMPDYADGDWHAAEVVTAPTYKLVSEKAAPPKVIETARPASMTEPRPGVFVFDMGRNVSGWCRLKVTAPAGTTITISYDERLHPDGTLHQRNAGKKPAGVFQTDQYTCRGGGEEVWEPRFVYHGFQYAQIEGIPGKPALDDLELRIAHASFDQIGDFECSNDLYNTIHKLTQRSYVSNFISYPTDCPHREKNGWTGDAQLASETGLYNYDCAPNYARWIDDFDDCQLEDGNLPGIVPTGSWGYEWGNGPAWDSAYFLIPWHVWLYRGDSRLLNAHYGGFKRYLDFVAGRSPDFIADFGLGDWCPPEGGPAGYQTPAALTSTAYYYVDAQIASAVAAMLGLEEDRRKYESLADAIKKAFIARFYDPATGSFTGGEQCGMAAALYQGLVPDGEKDKVLAALVSEVERRDGHIWAGILGTKYLLHALADNGRADLAYEAANKRDWPSWGHWIEQGATSLWEDWGGVASLNHIMFGDIDAWFYKTLAGIRPDPENPGFKHVIIRPTPVADLTWVTAHHNSLYGRMGVSWKLDGDRFTIQVEIPANTSATLYLPAGFTPTLTESGKPAGEADGVTSVSVRDGCAVINIGSGTYDFAAFWQE
jgi:alpha-L-rhamnosidase